MKNEHLVYEDTLKVIRLICLWSRDECKELEMSWQNPWPVGLGLGGCSSVGTEEWGDWLSFCLWAQLDILKKFPHPSDRPELGRSVSRWASLFLGHPDRHLKSQNVVDSSHRQPTTPATAPVCQQPSKVVAYTTLIDNMHQIGHVETISVITITSHNSVIMHRTQIKGSSNGVLAKIAVSSDQWGVT